MVWDPRILRQDRTLFPIRDRAQEGQSGSCPHQIRQVGPSQLTPSPASDSLDQPGLDPGT